MEEYIEWPYNKEEIVQNNYIRNYIRNFLSEIYLILKSSRIERALYIVSIMLIPAAFANAINDSLFRLAICILLLYSISGIHNAIKDKDYFISKYSKLVIAGLISIALLISMSNLIIFITCILELIFGVVYNTVSRKILFGDATVLGFSHAFLPTFAAGLLLNLDIGLILKISVFSYCFFWFIGTVRNQKDEKEDKKREYKTYATKFRYSRFLTKQFVHLYFFVMLLGAIIFDMGKNYLIIICLIYLFQMIILGLTEFKKDKTGMQIIRLVVILYAFAFTFEKATILELFYVYLILIIGFLFIVQITDPIIEFGKTRENIRF